MWERASSVPYDKARLAERRRSRRRRGRIALAILFLLLLAAAVYGIWQSSVRISRVTLYSEDTLLAQYAKEAMRGTYFGIIPRDSTFFFPTSRIRAAILADHPNIAAVSIFRNGFTGISLKPSERVPIARWCGTSPETRFDLEDSDLRSNLVSNCYVFDANGYIFAAATTSMKTINTFTLYAPLDIAQGEPPAVSAVEPLRATIAHADRIPTIFDFARQLGTRGSPTTHIVVRGDEVDAYLASGTRITYVLGKEQSAFTALISANENFNLSDGSIEYVDLRFDGKVYLKRK